MDGVEQRLFSAWRSTGAFAFQGVEKHNGTGTPEGRLSPTCHMHPVPCVTVLLVADAHLGRATLSRREKLLSLTLKAKRLVQGLHAARRHQGSRLPSLVLRSQRMASLS